VELMGWLRGSRMLRCRHRTGLIFVGRIAMRKSMEGIGEGMGT
jgi:hypothetical protein